MYKNRPKLIKFRKENEENDKSSHFNGFVKNDMEPNQKNKKIKRHIANEQQTTQIIKIEKIKKEPQQKMQSKDQKTNKNYQSHGKFGLDIDLSDCEQLPRSSYKKKQQNVKISMPKGYKTEESIKKLRQSLLSALKKNHQTISSEEIFQIPLTKQIMGIYPPEMRQLRFTCQEDQKEQRIIVENQLIKENSQVNNSQTTMIQVKNDKKQSREKQEIHNEQEENNRFSYQNFFCPQKLELSIGKNINLKNINTRQNISYPYSYIDLSKNGFQDLDLSQEYSEENEIKQQKSFNQQGFNQQGFNQQDFKQQSFKLQSFKQTSNQNHINHNQSKFMNINPENTYNHQDRMMLPYKNLQVSRFRVDIQDNSYSDNYFKTQNINNQNFKFRKNPNQQQEYMFAQNKFQGPDKSQTIQYLKRNNQYKNYSYKNNLHQRQSTDTDILGQQKHIQYHQANKKPNQNKNMQSQFNFGNQIQPNLKNHNNRLFQNRGYKQQN